MRRERFGRGRGSQGSSDSGRGGSGRGGPRRRNSRRRDGGGGRRGSHRRNERSSSISGNQRERISVESGNLVLIDQFMLANPQFVEKVKGLLDEEAEVKEELVKDYGGVVVVVEPGTYKIERDPYAFSIVIHPEGEPPYSDQSSRDQTKQIGQVFIDTRCLAMIDRELLDDSSLLEKYQQLWFSGQDKACRDLLRDNGGAVRYGFQKHGDELGIYRIPGKNVICLWPDIVQQSAPLTEGEAATAEA